MVPVSLTTNAAATRGVRDSSNSSLFSQRRLPVMKRRSKILNSSWPKSDVVAIRLRKRWKPDGKKNAPRSDLVRAHSRRYSAPMVSVFQGTGVNALTSSNSRRSAWVCDVRMATSRSAGGGGGF